MNRKMTDNDWTIRVLEKLRGIVMHQPLTSVVLKWEYDNDTVSEEENNALKLLSNAGLFDVSQLSDETDPFTRNEFGLLVHNGLNVVAYDFNNPLGKAVLNKFNSLRYEDFCRDYGLEPYEESYKATLDISSIGTPVVNILRKEYVLHPMQAGSTKELLATYLTKNPERSIELSEVKTIRGLGSVEYISKLIENSHFSNELSPFVTVRKDSITFHPQVNLTKEQVEAIKERSKKVS